MNRRVNLDDFNSVPDIPSVNGQYIHPDDPRYRDLVSVSNSRTRNGSSTLATPGVPELVLIDPKDVVERETDWIFESFLPVGSFALLTADGGTGKGTWTCEWAARITRGETDFYKEPQAVLFCGDEDALGSSMLPRLRAARANMSYIRFLGVQVDGQSGSVMLPANVPLLRQAIQQTSAALLVIDPVLNHLGREINTHVDQDVKRALTPLRKLADETGCTILAVHHFGKDTSRGARRSAMASISFPNSARIHLVMALDDEDDDARVLTVDKSNDGPTGISRKLRLELVQLEGRKRPVPRMRDEGDSQKSAHELLGLNETGQRGEKGKKAREIILRELETGPKESKELFALVKSECGASRETAYIQIGHLRDGANGEPRQIEAYKDGKSWWYRQVVQVPEVGEPAPVEVDSNGFPVGF